jgi:molecular chaperone GrpE
MPQSTVTEPTDVQEDDAQNPSDVASGETPADASGDADEATQEAAGADADAADPAAEESADDTADDTVEALREEVESLRQERDELNDQLLRKAAELDNYRKRMAEEKRRRHASGKLEAVRPILEVLDDFERSLDAASDLDVDNDPETAYESLKSGVEMVHRKFVDALEGLDVEPIEAEGEPFDEAYHEAMMRQPAEDVEPGTVVQEIRKGYVMGDRVIRHSRVIVATEPDA